VWYPDRSKATEKDPPLYLHIAATTKEILQNAIEKVNELIALDMGSLVEDKKDRLREKVRVCRCTSLFGSVLTLIAQRKWPEEKLPVGLESIRNFNVRAKVVGPTVGSFLSYSLFTFSRILIFMHRECSSNTSNKKRALAYRSKVSAQVSSTKKQVANPTSQCTST